MSALSLRLPESIHRHIREIAKKERVSINQFIVPFGEWEKNPRL
jgi:predicted HicB family RNase H-like nuclease